MYQLFAALTLAAVTSLTLAEDIFEQELRAGCAKVKSYAANGKKFYDQKQYAKAIEQFEQQAAWSSFCDMNNAESGISFSEQAITTAFNNVGLSYAKLGKPQWARAWFSVYPTAKNSQFNLKQLPVPKKSSNLAGKYVRYAGYGAWDTITVQKLKNEYKIDFEGYYMGLRSLIYGPNVGDFETSLPLNKSQAKYQFQDCRIDLIFQFDPKMGQQIKVKETPYTNCGFGHNVSAGGVYLKVE